MPYPIRPTIQIGALLELKLYIYINNQVGINVYWYKQEDAPVADDLLDALNDWDNQAKTIYIAAVNTDTIIRNSTLRQKTIAGWSQEYFSTNGVQNGASMPPLLPTQVSGIITRRVDAAGPSNRGRVYVPFPSIGDQDNDEHPTAAYVTALQNIADALMPQTAPMIVNGNSWVPGLYNPGALGQFRSLIQVTTHKKWATQRRRGDYGTPNT